MRVSQKDLPYLLSFCNTVPPQQPKFKVGDRFRIRRKIETFHRGYRKLLTDVFWTLSRIPTENPPIYVAKDVNDEIFQGKFYEPDLVWFVSTISKTATKHRTSQNLSFWSTAKICFMDWTPLLRTWSVVAMMIWRWTWFAMHPWKHFTVIFCQVLQQFCAHLWLSLETGR